MEGTRYHTGMFSADYHCPTFTDSIRVSGGSTTKYTSQSLIYCSSSKHFGIQTDPTSTHPSLGDPSTIKRLNECILETNETCSEPSID